MPNHDYRYEKDANGRPIKASTYFWKEKGYDGFLGFGTQGEGATGNCCLDCICDDNCAIGLSNGFPAGFGTFTAFCTDALNQSVNLSLIDLQYNPPYSQFTEYWQSYIQTSRVRDVGYNESAEPTPWYRWNYRLSANPWDSYWDVVKYPEQVEFANGFDLTAPTTTSPISFKFWIVDQVQEINPPAKTNTFATEDEAFNYQENDIWDIKWDISLFTVCEYNSTDGPQLIEGATLDWAVSLCETVIDNRTEKKFKLPAGGNGQYPHGTFYIDDERMSFRGDVWKLVDPNATQENIICSTEIQFPYLIDSTTPKSTNFLGGTFLGSQARGWDITFDKNAVEPDWIVDATYSVPDHVLGYRLRIYKTLTADGGLPCTIRIEGPLVQAQISFTAGQTRDFAFTLPLYKYDDLLLLQKDEYFEHKIIIVPDASASGTEPISFEVQSGINGGPKEDHIYTTNSYTNLQDAIDTTQEFTLQINKFNQYEFKSESQFL